MNRATEAFLIAFCITLNSLSIGLKGERLRKLEDAIHHQQPITVTVVDHTKAGTVIKIEDHLHPATTATIPTKPHQENK